ncbi:MAG: ABC-F family ATP-binding cassette domain-containing protein [Myxococcales bacterium]|nr:ABC-F family ATP-binding cassette domain-containing protein [Myxococcales bacterium]
MTAIDQHRARVEARGLAIETAGGRPLIHGLCVTLGRERVALVGRNGVGKSTLLEVLSGGRPPARGELITRGRVTLVPQLLRPEDTRARLEELTARAGEDPRFAEGCARELARVGLRELDSLASSGTSRGEARKLQLLAAKLDAPALLLLDEPTRDLDARGIAWLRGWLPSWPEGALVVSHDRGLLRCFEHFVVVAESGCRYAPGSFDALQRTLESERLARQRQYVRTLSALEHEEQHNDVVNRRRRRKKNVGRLHELDRCTPRSRLNKKASYAQESQARVARIRAARIDAARAWAKATRRALEIQLPLELQAPTLRPPAGPVIELDHVAAAADGRALFHGLSARISRERVAVLGPNGAGKTTLLGVMLGERAPATGVAARRRGRIGAIAQGASDWRCDESLLDRLGASASLDSLDALARLLLAHRFPLALAERPLRSLSPGERVRAALICLFRRAPAVELLVLDEPTDGLDLVGLAALQDALRTWPGGLVIVSHDDELLDGIGVDARLVLDGRGGHRWLEGGARAS